MILADVTLDAIAQLRQPPETVTDVWWNDAIIGVRTRDGYAIALGRAERHRAVQERWRIPDD